MEGGGGGGALAVWNTQKGSFYSLCSWTAYALHFFRPVCDWFYICKWTRGLFAQVCSLCMLLCDLKLETLFLQKKKKKNLEKKKKIKINFLEAV